MEGLFVPSPDVDPHKNALMELLLFKPLHAEAEMNKQGDPDRNVLLNTYIPHALQHKSNHTNMTY